MSSSDSAASCQAAQRLSTPSAERATVRCCRRLSALVSASSENLTPAYVNAASATEHRQRVERAQHASLGRRSRIPPVPGARDGVDREHSGERRRPDAMRGLRPGRRSASVL